MNENRMAGAIAGGLIAGLGITALLMIGERKSGKPSEIVTLERESLRRLDVATPNDDALPSAGEQAIVQGGHLLLSGLAGAAYAATSNDDTHPIVGGVLFGLSFYGLAHWLTGPALGVKPPEWRADAKTIGMHTVNHLVFGLVTAFAARLAGRSVDK